MCFMFKIDEFYTLCFQIIHVLSFRPNSVSFFQLNLIMCFIHVSIFVNLYLKGLII
ncbi:hypothetical protein Hanom_Chr02g00141421 [Helianthus anomalus]